MCLNIWHPSFKRWCLIFFPLRLSRTSDMLITNRIQRKWWYMTSEPRGLKDIVASLLLYLFQITHCRENQLPSCEILMKSYKIPCGQELRPLVNIPVSEPSWKTNLQPQSSFQVTEATTDILIATSCETLSQNCPVKSPYRPALRKCVR